MGDVRIDDQARPTHVRYFVLALTTLAAVLLYLDRYCISFGIQFIKDDLGLTNTQVGWVQSAFFWTYALAQVPAGYLTDRIGARTTLTLYILTWSLFTGLTGLATSFFMLILLRLGFGLAQAGAYPASANLISKWVPFSTRGFASGLVSLGGRLGGWLAPIATAALLVFCVPLSVPATLTFADMLDYPLVCRFLEDTSPANRDVLLAALTPAERRAMATHALHHRGGIQADVYFPEQRDHEIVRLIESLNQALARPDLVHGPNPRLTDVKNLPKEGKRLRDLPELSEEQLLRLNRLALEVILPDGIRKIYGHGWRPTMISFGLMGLFVGGLFWMWTRNRPDLHPQCNEAEVRLVEDSLPPGATRSKAGKIPLGRLSKNWIVWMMNLTQFGTNVGWLFLVTELPTFLEKYHKVEIEKRGTLSSLPILAGSVGLFCGGLLTDWLARRLSLRWRRGMPIAVTRFIAAGGWLVCAADFDLDVQMVMFCLIAFVADLGIPPMWAFALDVGGRYSGSVLGWANMWGNFGAAIAPLLLRYVVGEDGRWQYAFWLSAAALFLAGICSLFIDASASIVPPEEEQATT